MQHKAEQSMTEMRGFIDNQDAQKQEPAIQPPSQPFAPGFTPGIQQPGQLVSGQPVQPGQYQQPVYHVRSYSPQYPQNQAQPGAYVGQPVAYGALPNPLQQVLHHNQAQLQIQNIAGPDVMTNLNQIMIRQRPQYIQAFTDCEFENIYNIHTMQGGQKGKKIMKGREKSTCVARHCIGPECRPFNMFITKKKNLGKGGFLRFERNYAYTCLCCNRPYMLVYNIEDSMKGVDHKLLRPSPSDELIGRVHDPYNCCDLTFNCFNESGVKDYFIRGNCCQCGLCCHCPCGPCKRVNFKIWDKNEEEVGSIDKVWNSCQREFFSNADTYIANFPARASWKQKAVILAATIMIDFRHFEQKKKNNQY